MIYAKRNTIKNKLIWAFTLSITFFACNTKQSTPDELMITKAEQYMMQAPDSSLLFLESVNPRNLNSRQNANYNLLMIQAKDRNYIDISGDSLTIQEVINYFKKQNDILKTGKAYFYQNRIFNYAGRMDDAVYSCVTAKDYIRQTDDYNLMALIYNDLGLLYRLQYTFDESLENYKLSQEYFIKAKNEEYANIVYYDIGTVYLIPQNQPDKAKENYQHGLNYALQTNDSTHISLNYKGISLVYEQIDSIEQTKQYVLLALNYANTPLEQAINYRLLADLYSRLNRPDSALYYVDKLLNSSGYDTEDGYQRANNHAMFKEIYKQKGDYKSALEQAEIYVDLVDSLCMELNNKSVLEIQKKYDKEVVVNQYNEVLIQRLYLVVTVIIIILLAITFAWIFMGRIKKREKELTEAQQSLDTFRQLLSEQDKKLHDFNEVISDRDEKSQHLRDFLINQLDISRKVAQMNVVMTDDTKEFMKQFQRIFQKDMLDWENIYPHINELYNGFVDKIKEAYPNLTEKEVQLCCLIRARFRSDEQAVILHYTQNSIRVKRTQLVKKMGFENAEAFLENLMQI